MLEYSSLTLGIHSELGNRPSGVPCDGPLTMLWPPCWFSTHRTVSPTAMVIEASPTS